MTDASDNTTLHSHSQWPRSRAPRRPPACPQKCTSSPPTERASALLRPLPQLTLQPSLYVRNLPDKLPKEDLKRNLYMLFATYGVILDIVALKTPKMRGQAHIVFRDIDASTQAMRALDGSAFFGKDMVSRTLPIIRG